MKKNYRVYITDGKRTNSFTILGKNKESVRKLCEIVHTGTGWFVERVCLAFKKGK